jgi:5'(3')-deoxyribonucleotidase
MARIGLDIDGVSYRFVDTLRQYIHEKTGKPLSEMPPADTWDFFEDQWGISADEYIQFVTDGVRDRVVFWEGPVEEKCKEVVHTLRTLGHEVVFITARRFKGIESLCEMATKYWLDSNQIEYDEIIISNDKTGHNLDILLDDSPAQIESMVLHGGKALVFDQPWNQNLLFVDRVYGWVDFMFYILNNLETPEFEAEMNSQQ